jgi:hypothetical protein
LRLLVVFVPSTSSTLVATWFWQTEGRCAEHVILGVRPSRFILSEFQSPSRRFFIGSHSLPPGRLIGPSIMQPSSRITNTSGARSGADLDCPLDWPLSGAESPSAGAPAAPWSLVGWLPEQACPRPWGGAWGTNACEAAAASSCCGLAAAVVTCDGLPAATALAAVHGALSECRLVVAGVPKLSTLPGMRAGTVGVTLSTKKARG